MPISNSTSLFKLIKSMSKADKRNFKLYAKRVQGVESLKFIKLFDILEKMPELDDKKVMSKFKQIQKGQYSNLKRHLYSQILTSLRLISISRMKAIEIREQIDFAQILYAKGLFQQSLKLLQRAKNMSEKEELDLLTLEIVEFQKLIESRHITNSGPLKNDALTRSARETIEKVNNSIQLSNLRVNLHSYYIRNSHIKSENERTEIIEYLESRLPKVNETLLGYPEKVYLYQCFVWYYYILLDYEKCYEYAVKWVNVFEDDESLKFHDTDLYMRGYHYMLTASFNMKNIKKLEQHLDELQSFRKGNYAKFNENSKIFSFMYVHWARLNAHFLRGSFVKGVEDIPRTLRRINRYKERIAPHRLMVFYYKIAWMYLGSGRPEKAVNYISRIINDDIEDFREDIQSYSRLLFLMIHYDLDNMDLLPYLVRTVDGFFRKTEIQNKLQSSTLKFFKKIQGTPISDRPELFKEFKKELELIYQDPYEIRSFLYLDILSWVKARLKKDHVLEGMLTLPG